MVKRLMLVKGALVAMPTSIDHDIAYEDVAMEGDLRVSILEVSHWKWIAAMEYILKPLCSAITYLEGDEATFSAVYACFVAIAHHALTIPSTTLIQLSISREELLRYVHSRLKSIYTTAHALSFVTDPFFYDMRVNLFNLHGQAILDLGCGPLFGQCRSALAEASKTEGTPSESVLNEQFAHFLSLRLDGTFLYDARKLKPALIWSQVDDRDMIDLAKILVRIHSNPSGAVGGERNHKTNNRVRSKQRIWLGTESCQRQVAVAFNSLQLERVVGKRRVDPFVTYLANIGSPLRTSNEDFPP
uniref:Uncharacterized protein n=1 Tax=Spongospora subterranea TaxID=70186 RepID=A0A0H5RT02_9EUKA|eukprot:CRZ11859.1 hypothetical protein [Spongospora subterranea]